MNQATSYLKKKKVSEIKALLKSKSILQERKYIVRIPPVTEHKFHQVGQVCFLLYFARSVGSLWLIKWITQILNFCSLILL